MPAGLNKHDRGAGFEPRVNIALEPFPGFVPQRFAFRFGAVFDRVVDDGETRSVTGDTSPGTDRTQPAARRRFPFGDRVGGTWFGEGEHR